MAKHASGCDMQAFVAWIDNDNNLVKAGLAPNTIHRTRTSVQTTRTHVQIFRTNVQMLPDGLIWAYPEAALDVTIRNQNQN